MTTNLHLEARKEEAKARFLQRLERARKRKGLPRSSIEAYLLGLREGYGDGLVDGVKLGTDVTEEAANSYDSPEIGVA